MEESNETFYFVAFVRNRQALTVIDLAYTVDYERNDWDAVNDENFHDPDTAIRYARKLADKYGLEYQLFDSRYDSSLSERLSLSLDEQE